jgi:hypothetical protein
MKRIIVTPSGRKDYLSILINYLSKFKEQFDEWHLWVNTVNPTDIEYMESLRQKYHWIKLIPLTVPYERSSSIYSFFSIDACDPECVYLRLDDDIVYIDSYAIENIFNYRLSNKQPFLVSGNVVNNGICNHIHQRLGACKIDHILDYNSMGNSWYNPSIAIDIHEAFLKSYFSGETYKYTSFSSWVLNLYERISINVISWLGSTFKEFEGIVGKDEEKWLSVDKPASIKTHNVICGTALFSHYSYYTQIGTLDETKILHKYSIISRRW